MRRGGLGTLLLVAMSWLGGCALPGMQPSSAAEDADRGKPPRPGDVARSPTPRINPMTHFAAGQMLEHQSDLQGAIEQYEKAIAMNPRFTTAYNRLGIVYQKLARYEDAEHIFKEGILADAGAAILRNNLGYTYLLQNRLPEAEAQFRDALQIAPDFKRARMNLAISLARAGRTEDSLIEFSRVVPADVAHFDVGVIRLDLKDYAAAESAFREALSLNPSCPRAKVYLEHTLRLAGGERANPPSPPGQISRNESLAGQIGDEAIGPPAP